MVDKDILRFEDMFYVLLFREELQNKSLLRFGKVKIPQVDSNLMRSRFSFLRSTLEVGRIFYVLYHLGKDKMEGVGHLLDLPTVVQEFPEFVLVDCAITNPVTPALLPQLILPDIPDKRKGVVVQEHGLSWLTSHLVVEYSKVASWVAVGKGSSAVVVFTMVPEVPLGKIIEI